MLIIRKLKYRLGLYNSSHSRRGYAPVLTFFLTLSVLVWGFSVVEAHIKPTLTTLASAYVKNISTRNINNSIMENLSSKDVTYDSLVIITKNDQGNITGISTNVIEFNKLKSDITLVAVNELENLSNLKMSIPLGSVMGSQLFAGRGPKIPIRLIPASSIEVEVKNNFISCGINQTKHEIFLDVRSNLAIAMPAYNIESVVTTQIPIAETVIVGSVPENYTSISGSTRTAADNAIAIE